MHSHRINETLALIKPYWLKNQELSLFDLLKLISTESGFDKALSELSDEVIIYHLKMDQTAKDCEDNFQTALLKARGLL